MLESLVILKIFNRKKNSLLMKRGSDLSHTHAHHSVRHLWGEGCGLLLGAAMLKTQAVTVVKGIKASAKWHVFDVVQ